MAVARERNIAQLNPIHQWMRLLEDYDLRSFARGVNFSESLVKIAYLAGALLSTHVRTVRYVHTCFNLCTYVT